MARPARLALFRRLLLVLLGGMAAPWSAPAVAQEAAPLTLSALPVKAASPAGADSQDLLQRLGKLEQRLDWLAQQNDILLRENQVLTERLAAPFPNNSSPGPQGLTSSPLSGTGTTSSTASGGAGVLGSSPIEGVGPWDRSGQSDSGGDGSRSGSGPAAGSGSERAGVEIGGGRSLSTAAGGDPTAVGRAQEVGNRHLGMGPLSAYYDFDNAGFHLDTADREFTLGFFGMTQLDGMLYARPTPGPDTSSGFYNPRSRIYFEGHFTKPISWEFSFQNFFDTVQLLDAYVNFNYDPRFQVQIGRFKNPFGYEFYRMHIWDLMAPERSLWAVNYEANRRFGLMAHGVLADERVEYALGSFDTQRNGFRAFNGDFREA
jgi:phosphate-selective porin OprO/OprP